MRGFPGALSALLLIIAVFGAIAAVGFTISVPASGWIQKAPESLPLLKEKLAIFRQPLDYLQNGLKELENLTGPTAGAESSGQTVTVKQGSGLTGSLATGTAMTLSRSFTTMIILFFLLASGDRLLRGFVEVSPRFKDKRTAVEIASEIEENISRYLLTITMMNAFVGVATGIAMKLCGLGDPILWGVMAFLLNYIPILRPMTGVVIFFLVGTVTFDWVCQTRPPGHTRDQGARWSDSATGFTGPPQQMDHLEIAHWNEPSDGCPKSNRVPSSSSA